MCERYCTLSIHRAQSYETLVLDTVIKNASQKDKTKTNNNTQARNVPVASTCPYQRGKRSEDGSDGIDCSLPVQPISTDNSTARPPKTKITDYIEVDPSLFGEDEDPKSILGQALMDDFRNHWTLDKIARYETRLENSMIRCLGKFQKVRESKMMNFSSLRQYYREFQPRPQDYQDSVGDLSSEALAKEEASVLHSKSASTPQESSSNVAQPPSAVINETDKTNPIVEIHPNDQLGGTANRSLTVDLEGGQDSAQQPDDSIDSRIENDPNALPMDSFTHWRKLYCEPKGYQHNCDDGLDIPAVQHRPDVPEEDEFIFRKGWQHRVLDMVEYPWKKRHNLTEAELNELVDSIICGFPNPTQFLWDFNLIELTAAASAKRRLPALAG
jgi:hypothetical protein